MERTQQNILYRYYKSSQHKIYLVRSLALFLFIVALAVAFQHYYIIDVQMVPRFSLSWHIPFNLFYFSVWLIFLPLIEWSDTNLRHKNSRVINRIIFYLLLPITFVFVHQLIATVVINLVLDYMDLYSLFYQRMLRNPWIWEDFVIYFLIMAGIGIQDYQTKTDIHLFRASQLQSQLAQTQLRALKSQLHPHFLFNTLNTLSTLILKQDNFEAERMLGLLEKFLKTTLNESEKSEVSLSEELKFIRHYLEIEKVRFKDKLVVEEVIGVGTITARVPVFLLQPIVENSIHHAIATKTTEGIIRIISRKERGNLVLIVEDNGPGMVEPRKKKSKEGVGLKISRERLVQLYSANQSLELNKSTMGGLQVVIKIPFIEVSVLRTSES